MLSSIQKHFSFVSLALLVTLVVILFLSPAIYNRLNIALLAASLGMALIFVIQKHLPAYKQGKITSLKFALNVLLDILGLLLTIAVASYLGNKAGAQVQESLGVWAGLATGITAAFVAAWGMRKLWNKLSGKT